MRMALEFQNVNFSYGITSILEDVSFQVFRKEITGIIGQNGAGKTSTILNAIGLLKPNSGKILFDNIPIDKIKKDAFPIAFIPDTPVLFEELTILEHLTFVKTLFNRTEDDINKVIKKFELSKHLYKIPNSLSKGTKQKLMIACTLLRRFELLIADEPFEGLDPIQISILKDTCIELKKEGKGVLLSTHLLNMVDDICDRYIIVNNGNILASGTLKEIQDKFSLPPSSLEKTYLTIVNI
jgi:ABC-2 type transport system ATP-binding protein